MGRVINPERAGKERDRLARTVVGALRQLGQQSEVDERTRDLAAYVALALGDIFATIDTTVEAWEKRGYWVKADRYRMEWMWADRYGKQMVQALLAEDWGAVAGVAAELGSRLRKYEEPKRKRLEEPWEGAWRKLESKSKKN